MFNNPRGRPTTARSATYGGIPSWLRNPTAPVGRILEASSARPVLAIQGDTVSVALPRGRVLVTAVGPTVPVRGRFPLPSTTPCTFIVTFAAASAAISLSPRAFTVVDERHHLHHPRVIAIAGGAPPRLLLPNQTLSLAVHGVLPTGNASLEWAPEKARAIVAWDFDVEID